MTHPHLFLPQLLALTRNTSRRLPQWPNLVQVTDEPTPAPVSAGASVPVQPPANPERSLQGSRAEQNHHVCETTALPGQLSDLGKELMGFMFNFCFFGRDF